MKFYLVGGAVRDQLLNRNSHDKDYVVVGSTPDEMIKKGFIPVGESFPVFLHPETKEEYALARKEIKTAKGHKGFKFQFSPDVSLEEDLKRRDLTINAIALDLETQEIIDPYEGKNDLNNKILRHVSKHFVEDPLRVLRVARFKAKFPDFSIAPETKEIMAEISYSSELNSLSGERILNEVIKTFETENPDLFFRVLEEVHALPSLFPELQKLVGVTAGPVKYHPEGDSFEHTMLVLKNARRMSPKFEVLFSALVHDLGKGITPKEILPSHRGHEITGLPLIEKLSDRIKVPHSWKDLALVFTKNHLKIHQVFQMKAKGLHNFLLAVDAYRRPSRLQDYLICSKADRMGKLSTEFPSEDFLEKVYNASSQIDYSDLLGKYSGQKLGEMINRRRINLISTLISKDELNKAHTD